MKGIVGATSIKTRYGTYVVRIECKDQKSFEKLVKKLRLIGIYIEVKKL
jgi:hypothetical protein